MASHSQIHSKHSLLPGVSCLCTIILLLICSLLCCSGGSDKDYYKPYRLSFPFKQTDGFLFLGNSNGSRRISSGGGGGLESYMETNFPAYNLSDNGWFFLFQPILLWKYKGDGMGINEASFTLRFTMSIYQPKNQAEATNSSLVFAICPSLDDAIPVSSPQSGTSDTTDSTLPSNHVSAQILTVYGTASDPRNISLVQIDVESPGNYSSVGSNYSVWMEYDHVEHRISVSVEATDEGTSSVATANASLKFSDIMPPAASFGFYSSMGQLLQLDAWSLTAERLPYSYSYSQEVKAKSFGNIILSSVLGSAAAVAITATAVYIYLNSKYRKWRKEQDKLAKTMQRLPGVPTQVDYADINKATRSFHETMKLGKGGFGAVYRCTLPAASLRRGQGMEVAVKKFTRDVEDQRYDDFLAEVSIINRLRHKNIVPLVGE